MGADGYKQLSNSIINEYDAVLAFAKKNRSITYDRFDSAIVRNVNLFAPEEQFDFSTLNENLDYIIGFLSVFKRIMARPIIRLKDREEILPVEAVRLVNNRTVVHASVHSELWENVGENGVRPKKLMTTQQQDDYAIYENLVVARALETTLYYVNKNIRSLHNLLYTDRNMRFNLLERVNHLSYFLAIGKLHIGYVRDYDKYRSDAERCLEKLLFIDRILKSRLNCPLYRKCGGYKKELVLKKTNIFRNQKDYHRIYLLMKWFEEHQIDCYGEPMLETMPSAEAYSVFCSMMCVFAAGHFNFLFEENRTISFEAPDQNAVFLDWKLHIGTEYAGDRLVIVLSVKKDQCYRSVLVPVTDLDEGSAVLKQVQREIAADEYHLLIPVRQKGALCISIFDVESFRRIQQILLRSMIYADEKKETCPFCANSLFKEEGGGYACPVCRTKILSLSCEKTKQRYFATAIKNFVPSHSEIGEGRFVDQLLVERLSESMLHYRNITEIDCDGEAVCPYCGVKHF